MAKKNTNVQPSKREVKLLSEESRNFTKSILPRQNPGILKAKRNNIAYTVAQKHDIVEIRDNKPYIIGHIKNKDIKIEIREYQLP